MAKVKSISDFEEKYSPFSLARDPAIMREIKKKQERRKSRRIRDPILIFLYKNRWGNKAARPLDLGLEGIGIQTASPLDVNESLQISIIIGECQINALGRVVYTRKEKSGRFRSGIKFEEISERNKGIIRLYLEKTHQLRRPGHDEGNL